MIEGGKCSNLGGKSLEKTILYTSAKLEDACILRIQSKNDNDVVIF